MKRGKKAQFYLLAAIIISVYLFAFVANTNKIYFKNEPYKIYDLGNNLETEGLKLIDYGIYNEKDISTVLNNFTDLFAEYMRQTEEHSELIILTGDNANVSYFVYTSRDTGTIDLDLGGASSIIIQRNGEVKKEKGSDSTTNGNLTIKIEDINYNFNLNKGENFIFLLTKDEEFEKFVSSNYEI